MSLLPSAFADSNDPFSSRLKKIQDALRKLAEEQLQVDELEQEDANATSYSVLKYTDKFSYAIAQVITDFDEMPEEPDFTYLRFHYRFDHKGNTLYDQSHFEGNGQIKGFPELMVGLDWGMFGGDLCWDLDGIDDMLVVPSSSENNEFEGRVQFSFVFLVFPKDLTLQNGMKRTLLYQVEEVGDLGVAHAKKIELGTDGKIYFSLRYLSQDRFFESPANSIVINAWQWIILTYNDAAPTTKSTCYVNGVAKTMITSSNNPLFIDSDDDDMYIGAYGSYGPAPADLHSDEIVFNGQGFFKGGIQDARYYIRVLTQTEAQNLNTNKISVSPIALGRVATIGGSAFNE
jgi:Concanavalin A-like lectin/glucanases superfamily